MNPSSPGYKTFFSPDFKADLAWWYRTHSKKANKILELVADVLDEKPSQNWGKPGPPKYIDRNRWSRRIDLEYRSVHQTERNNI